MKLWTPPFPFPPPGESRGGRVPPTPEARYAPAKSAGTQRCCRLPPQEGCRPLVHPLRAQGGTDGGSGIPKFSFRRSKTNFSVDTTGLLMEAAHVSKRCLGTSTTGC